MGAFKAVRITDPYVLGKIEEIRKATGERTGSRTAARMILERVGQVELTGFASAASHFGIQPIAPTDARSSGMASAVA